MTPRFAHYIHGATYDRLVLEVDRVAGLEPYPEVEQRLVQRLAQVLDKPAGIVVEHDDVLPARGNDHVWTEQALFDLATDRFRSEYPEGTVAMHVMMLDGHSERDDGESVILGLAWSQVHIAIFKETILRRCRAGNLLDLLSDAACIEAELGILTHEVGHILGLVDNGLPMITPHRDPDPDRGRHDHDPDCIMYWAYVGAPLLERVTTLLQNGGGSLGFCAHCLNDIAALR